MQLKQANIVLCASMAVVALIVVVAAVLVVGSFRDSSEARANRDTQFKKFKSLCAEDPSPIPENIDLMGGNIDVETEWCKKLLDDLGEPLTFRQVESSSVFGSRREQVVSELRAAAPIGLAGTKVVPDTFLFGFEAYKEGRMPDRAEVPRLLYQLELIDAIVREMYASEVLQIVRVEREVFEQSGAIAASDGGEEEDSSSRRRRRGGGRRNRDTSDEESSASGGSSDTDRDGNLQDFSLPLNRQRFHFEFLAREKGVVGFLNRLAAMDRYVAVTRLEINKIGPDIAAPREEERGPRRGPGGRRPPRGPVEEEPAEPGATPELPLSRLARTFTGRNLESPVAIKMDVEVYAVYRDAAEVDAAAKESDDGSAAEPAETEVAAGEEE